MVQPHGNAVQVPVVQLTEKNEAPNRSRASASDLYRPLLPLDPNSAWGAKLVNHIHPPKLRFHPTSFANFAPLG